MKSFIAIVVLSLAIAGCTARARVASGPSGPPPSGPPPSEPAPPPGGDRASDQRADNQADRAADASSAWDKIGQRNVNGRADSDVISARKAGKGGPYRKIKLVVESGALEMYDILVVFENGENWSPNVRHTFGPGTTSRTIDLPGGTRHIRNVKFKYGNIPGGGQAQVELWASP